MGIPKWRRTSEGSALIHSERRDFFFGFRYNTKFYLLLEEANSLEQFIRCPIWAVDKLMCVINVYTCEKWDGHLGKEFVGRGQRIGDGEQSASRLGLSRENTIQKNINNTSFES